MAISVVAISLLKVASGLDPHMIMVIITTEDLLMEYKNYVMFLNSYENIKLVKQYMPLYLAA